MKALFLITKSVVQFYHAFPVIHIIFIINVIRYAMIAGRNKASTFDHKRHDASEESVNCLFALGKNTLIDTANHNNIRILFGKLYNIISCRNLERTHDIHVNTFVIKPDRFCYKTIGIDLNKQFLFLLTVSDIGNGLLIIWKKLLADHIRTNKQSEVVADILSKKILVIFNMLLNPRSNCIGNFEPPLHHLVYEPGIIH